jgi:hypothetical protein
MAKKKEQSLLEIPGSRAALIKEALQTLLVVPEELLKNVCSAVEKLTNDAYTEGYQDGQWS